MQVVDRPGIERATQVERRAEMAAVRVLLIHASAEARETLAEALEELGYQATVAATGEEAHDVETVPDAIVCDSAVSDYSTAALLDELYERPGWEEVPAITVGGHDHPRKQAGAAKAGFARCLPKPVSINALHVALREVTAARR